MERAGERGRWTGLGRTRGGGGGGGGGGLTTSELLTSRLELTGRGCGQIEMVFAVLVIEFGRGGRPGVGEDIRETDWTLAWVEGSERLSKGNECRQGVRNEGHRALVGKR